MAWNLVTAGSVALAACLVLLGRTDLARPSMVWTATFAALFLATLLWLTRFSGAFAASRKAGSPSLFCVIVMVNGPLTALALATSGAIYLSDSVNHHVSHFMWPTAPLLVLLAVSITAVAQSAVRLRAEGASNTLSSALQTSGRWALPLSLALLGFFQGGAYLWVIGNDFTRYWNVADAIASWSGYPALPTLPLYVQIGEPPYTVDLPGYPLALLAAFKVLGHDTLAGHVPNLLANVALPWLFYVFFRGAGIGRAIAFAGSAALTTQPFFRLYTLNAPVPDAFFLAILTATAISYQRVASSEKREEGLSSGVSLPAPRSTQHSGPGTQDWILFGFLAGATALTRPEGVFFLAFMGLGLLPSARQRGPWMAGAVAAAMLAPVVAIYFTTFGFLWPNNAGSTIGLQHVGTNIYWLEKKTLWWYANAFQLSMPQFLTLLGLLGLGLVAGTVLMVKERWKLALLPIGAAVNVGIVFTVDQSVSGVHLWFDFFRHISYALPFLALAAVYLLERLSRWADARKGVPAFGAKLPAGFATYVAASLLLLVALYHADLLSRPAQTYGGSQQLLTSDTWVSLQDIAAHRYQLPPLQHDRNQAGVLVLEREFDRQYMVNHLDSVQRFFEPYSTLIVNKGSEYMLASILIMLFGAAFAFVRP